MLQGFAERASLEELLMYCTLVDERDEFLSANRHHKFKLCMMDVLFFRKIHRPTFIILHAKAFFDFCFQ
jgi:hypothetical protein